MVCEAPKRGALFWLVSPFDDGAQGFVYFGVVGPLGGVCVPYVAPFFLELLDFWGFVGSWIAHGVIDGYFQSFHSGFYRFFV